MSSSTSSSSRLPGFLVRSNAAIALVLGFVFLASALYLWVSFHLHIPIRDTLRLMPFVQDVLERGLFPMNAGDWLAPHSGAHRIAVIRAALVIDHAFFGGQNHFVYLTAWLGIVAMLALLLTAFRRSYPGETPLLVFVFGLCLAFLLSPTQTWNMMNPINSSWYVSLSAAAASVFLVAGSPHPPALSRLFAAYLLAVIAALANFSGVFVLLLLPVLVALRNARLGLFCAAASGMLLFLYLRDINTGPVLKAALDADAMPGWGDRIHRPIERVPAIVSNVCRYLGSPLSLGHPGWATSLVALSFAVLGTGWIALIRGRFLGRPESGWHEITLAIATLALGIALATSLGRGLILEPTTERYQTVVMLYWLCICGLLIAFALKNAAARPWRQVVSTTLCLAILAAFQLDPTFSVRNSAMVAQQASRFSALTMLGASEGLNARLLLFRGQPRALADLDPFFRKRNSGYWRDAGSTVDVKNAVDCAKVIMQLAPSKWPGILVATARITGFRSRFSRQVTVLNAGGEVAGYLMRDFSVRVSPWRLLAGNEDHWKGYVRSDALTDDGVYLHGGVTPFTTTACRPLISWEKEKPHVDAHRDRI